MIVLSLFDGISCGQIALQRANIAYDRYFASEINKQSIKVTQRNYPETIQIGDVQKVSYKDGILITEKGKFHVGKIDLLIAGSPCQGFSKAGKELNFKDERSKLYFEFLRILKETRPKYFLLENVKMKSDYSDIITRDLGVKPILINSRLVSAQDRKRLYWTNIKNVQQPNDKNVSFQDITPGWFCGCMRGRRVLNNKRCDYNKDVPLQQYIECRKDNKTNCLTTVTKDNVAIRTKQRFTKISDIEYRYLTPNEYEKLQTVPIDYTIGASDSARRTMLAEGWTVDVIAHILKYINLKSI
jgi:site-specific DNA-cytosine methylase|nr:MAG TPA: Cytosine specific methyltransferase [Caudoviricetes sp.]